MRELLYQADLSHPWDFLRRLWRRHQAQRQPRTDRTGFR